MVRLFSQFGKVFHDDLIALKALIELTLMPTVQTLSSTPTILCHHVF